MGTINRQYISVIACGILIFAGICLTVFYLSAPAPSVSLEELPFEITDNAVFVRAAEGGSDEPAYAQGELMLRLNKPLGQNGSTIDPLKTGFARLDGINRSLGVSKITLVSDTAKADAGGLYLYKFSFSAPVDPIGAAANYSGIPIVAYAEPDYVVTTAAVNPPDDPYWPSSGSWAQGYDDLWGLKKIDAFNAWQVTTGDPSVVVAVLDTGLDMTHPDIQDNIWNNPGETGLDGSGKDKQTNGIDDDGNGYIDDWRGWDFNNHDNDPTDDMGHGTHVAGTIAAVGNNGTGIVGVNWQAKIMPLKFLDSSGSGFLSNAIPAIIYAADNGARISNNSWGGSGYSQSLADAFNYAHNEKDMTIVAAAGNSNADAGLQQPAAFSSVITVAATDVNDVKASFSNWGSKIDVAAPGVSILSLYAKGTSMCGPIGTYYCQASGTSMASPHVAGLASLMLASHPEWTSEQVRQVIRSSADDLGAAGRDDSFGYGRIDAAAAVNAPSPLVAFLSGPVGKVQGSVNITGTAGGNGFTSYRLEYGQGKNPDSWTTMTASNVPVSNGVLYPGFDSSIVPDGDVTLRLTVYSSGSSVQQLASITVDNVYISAPASDLIAPASGTINITGRAAGAGFNSFEIFYGAGSDPTAWSSAGLAVTGGGTNPVGGGALASWNTSTIEQAGFYTIRLLANINGRREESMVTIYIDPALRTGWPKSVDIGSSLAFMDVPTVADVDGDGTSEIALAYGSQIYLLRSDGTDFPGWPKTITGTSNFQSSPAIGDIDGDGGMEIVMGTDAYLYAWDADGTIVSGWPVSGFGKARPVISDIDGDGINEVISVAANRVSGGIRIVSGAGKTRTGWPIDGPIVSKSQPAVGDINGDGYKDIVFAADDGKVYAYSTADGTLLPNWPVAVSTKNLIPYSYPVLADLDDNGSLEVIIGTADFTGTDSKVHLLKGEGTEMAGWPQNTTGPVTATPSIGDLDGDGVPEIIAGDRRDSSNIERMYVWHIDGSLMPGWPVSEIAAGQLKFGFGSAAMADIDADGSAEIIVANDTTYLNVYEADGTKAAGLYMGSGGSHPSNTPAIGDFDNDGKVEIVGTTFSKKIFMWDLPAVASGADEWPQFRHDAAHTGAHSAGSGSGSPVPPPPAEEIPIVTSVHPSGWVTSTSADISATVTSTGITADSVIVKLDGNVLENCSLNDTTIGCPVSTLTAGAHAVSVSATNGAGTGSANGAFQVDAKAPSLSGLAPEGLVKTSLPTITAAYADAGSGIKGGTARVVLDGSDLSGCTSGNTGISCPTSGLANGSHDFTVRVEDIAGNSANASGSFTVDNTGPAVSSISPNGWLNTDSAEIIADYSDGFGTGVDPATVVINLDGALLGGCAVGPTSASCSMAELAQGDHSIAISLSDYAGNTSSALGSFAVDIDAPAAGFSLPAGIISDTSPTLVAVFSDSGSGIDTGTAQISLDGRQLSGCNVNNAGISCPVSGLSEGIHVLALSVMDNAGNDANATGYLRVDSIAPTITNLSSFVTNSREVIISAAYSDLGSGIDTKSVQASLDGTWIADCAIAAAQVSCPVTGLADGVHPVMVTARDLAGNTGTKYGSITIDTVSPAMAGLLPSGTINGSNIDISATLTDDLSGVDMTSVLVTLDNVMRDGCSVLNTQISCPVNNLSDGTHTVTVRGSDLAGNLSMTSWTFIKQKNKGIPPDHAKASRKN